ncbi:uncharacterized protein LOC111089638 [Limulus polyphemus]|uniref:Uncharacterized protein LOC111089638 n=1 Tax=Limulus polyphemus TaxID=6850 RepID=A0ABM1TQQ5_LIMPO|nr:uncharacterized protein LOC111089638 [Limulus polyphemus]
MCERFSQSSKRTFSVENNLQLDGDIEKTRNKATSKIFRAKLKEGIKNCTITSDSQLASETASRLNSNIGLASKRCKKNQSTLVKGRNRIARKHSQICDWLYIERHNSDSDKETSVEKSEIQPRGNLSLKRKRDKKKAKCKSQRSGLKKEQKTVEKSSKSYKENHGNVEENFKSTIHHLKTEKLSENSNKKVSFPVLNVCKRQNPEKCICFSRDYNNLTLKKLKDTAGSISESPLIQESLTSYNEQYISRHKIKLKCVSSKKSRKQSPTEFEMCYRKLVQPLSKINNQLSWKNSTEDNPSKKTKPKKINFSLEQEGKMAFVSENKGIPHVQDSSEKKKKRKLNMVKIKVNLNVK